MMDPSGELKGKVALVTGGSRGIGRAISLKLASLGAKVGVNYLSREAEARSAVEAIAAAGSEALALQTDVSQRQAVEAMVAQLRERWGRIDILVNNAGIIRDALLLRMSDEDWDAVLDTNLRGAFLCARAVLGLMVRQRWGRIVNIASVVGLVGNPGQTNYSASKAGLVGFTKALAREVASRNITVNAVAPGFIATEILDVVPAKRRQELLAHIPQQRYGTPEEVAELVAFLCGERASYITGQVIAIDGGLVL